MRRMVHDVWVSIVDAVTGWASDHRYIAAVMVVAFLLFDAVLAVTLLMERRKRDGLGSVRGQSHREWSLIWGMPLVVCLLSYFVWIVWWVRDEAAKDGVLPGAQVQFYLPYVFVAIIFMFFTLMFAMMFRLFPLSILLISIIGILNGLGDPDSEMSLIGLNSLFRMYAERRAPAIVEWTVTGLSSFGCIWGLVRGIGWIKMKVPDVPRFVDRFDEP